MCKQDIKIGRRVTSVVVKSGAALGAGSIQLPARANRIGISVCITPFSTDPRDGWSVGYSFNNSVVPLVFINYVNPSAYLDIERYGTRVVGDIVALEQVFTTASPIAFVDFFLRDDLDSID